MVVVGTSYRSYYVVSETYFFLICLCVRTMYVHTMCGNAGPHMPWHSCRGERTTFGVSSHCPLCFRQGALCLYHCRCRNSWPVSFQDCRLCSHLGAALGSTQGAVSFSVWILTSEALVLMFTQQALHPKSHPFSPHFCWRHGLTRMATELIILLPQP